MPKWCTWAFSIIFLWVKIQFENLNCLAYSGFHFLPEMFYAVWKCCFETVCMTEKIVSLAVWKLTSLSWCLKPEMLYAVNALAESTWKGCFYDMVICALVHAKLPLACASEIVAVNKTAVPEGLLCLPLQRFFSCCYNIYTRVTRLL